MQFGALIGDEIIRRPPFTIAEMQAILLSGQSISYHGESGDRFITTVSEIPPIEALVADGYIEQAVAAADLTMQIAKLDKARRALEHKRQTAIGETKPPERKPYKKLGMFRNSPEELVRNEPRTPKRPQNKGHNPDIAAEPQQPVEDPGGFHEAGSDKDPLLNR